VGATTVLTALMAGGALLAFALAARLAGAGGRPHAAGAGGLLVGLRGLCRRDLRRAAAVGLAVPRRRRADRLWRRPVSVGTLTAAMGLDVHRRSLQRPGAGRLGRRAGHRGRRGHRLGGALRDAVSALATRARWVALAPGHRLQLRLPPRARLLFATLVAIGPLVRRRAATPRAPARFGLAEFPG
jgi:BCD family chlorophyll transporter-like MFS transporter